MGILTVPHSPKRLQIFFQRQSFTLFLTFTYDAHLAQLRKGHVAVTLLTADLVYHLSLSTKDNSEAERDICAFVCSSQVVFSPIIFCSNEGTINRIGMLIGMFLFLTLLILIKCNDSRGPKWLPLYICNTLEILSCMKILINARSTNFDIFFLLLVLWVNFDLKGEGMFQFSPKVS